jgi:hypothetical protein
VTAASCTVEGCSWVTEPGDTYGVLTNLATHLLLLHGIAAEVAS